jgi:dTDP-4-amino-4,6-dideoxygalactose transaminase
MIPFNKVYLSGNEIKYITDAANSGKLSGDGNFTKRCHEYFEKEFSFLKVLLTTSCTHALEMAALLLDIQPGDEVIVPSFTFVSTANAFALRGASIVFADSLPNNPNIDPKEIERLITPKTKAIAIVHYAGFACDMEAIMGIANKHNIPVVEDAARLSTAITTANPSEVLAIWRHFPFTTLKISSVVRAVCWLSIKKNIFSGRKSYAKKEPTGLSSSKGKWTNTDGWISVLPTCHPK